jgi:hypothetical protein
MSRLIAIGISVANSRSQETRDHDQMRGGADREYRSPQLDRSADAGWKRLQEDSDRRAPMSARTADR